MRQLIIRSASIRVWLPASVLMTMIVYFAHDAWTRFHENRRIETKLNAYRLVKEEEIVSQEKYINYTMLKYQASSQRRKEFGSLMKRISDMDDGNVTHTRQFLDNLTGDFEHLLENKKGFRPVVEQKILDTLVQFNSPEDQLRFYKTKLMHFSMNVILEEYGTHCNFIVPHWKFQQVYNPIEKKYMIYFGDYIDAIGGMYINGKHTMTGEFQMEPTQAGLHRVQIVVPNYDDRRLEITYDTMYHYFDVRS